MEKRRLKTVTAIVGHFSLNGQAPTKKVTAIVEHFAFFLKRIKRRLKTDESLSIILKYHYRKSPVD